MFFLFIPLVMFLLTDFSNPGAGTWAVGMVVKRSLHLHLFLRFRASSRRPSPGFSRIWKITLRRLFPSHPLPIPLCAWFFICLPQQLETLSSCQFLASSNTRSPGRSSSQQWLTLNRLSPPMLRALSWAEIIAESMLNTRVVMWMCLTWRREENPTVSCVLAMKKHAKSLLAILRD